MRNYVISCNPEVMGGTPVFSCTRVPVQTLLDPEAGESIDVKGFPSVSRQHVIALFEQAKDRLVASQHSARQEYIFPELSGKQVDHLHAGLFEVASVMRSAGEVVFQCGGAIILLSTEAARRFLFRFGHQLGPLPAGSVPGKADG